MQSLLQRTTAFLTPSTSSTNLSKSSSVQPSPSSNSSSTSSSSPYIFPTVEDPSCILDCSTCTTHYPPKFSIDESDALYGHINGWSTHLLIATGKSDWVRDVADEKGSVMEGIGKLGLEKRGEGGKRCMVSACNMPVPDYGGGGILDEEVGGEGKRERERGETEVLVLPKWEIVEGVRPSEVRGFMEGYVERVGTTMDPVSVSVSADRSSTGRRGEDAKQPVVENGTSQPSYSSSSPSSDQPTSSPSTSSSAPKRPATPAAASPRRSSAASSSATSGPWGCIATSTTSGREAWGFTLSAM
jgi:Sucrase/ferredoxin-like